MSHTFICVSTLKKDEKKVIISMGKYHVGGKHTFFKETRKTTLLSEENANLLAVFTTLRKIEELGLREVKIFHSSSSLDLHNGKRLKRYPQLFSIKKRVERMKRKGFKISFKRYVKTNHSHLTGFRNMLKKSIKEEENKENVSAKVIPIRPTLKTERVKAMIARYKSKDEIALVDHFNHVIDYLSEKEIKRLLRKKSIKKLSNYSYQYAKNTYEAHRDIEWLNIKQLEISSLKLSLDHLLPFSKRKYTKAITHNESLCFVLSKRVADKLVKEESAVYTNTTKKEIKLLFSKDMFRGKISSRDKNICQYCHGTKKMTLEHVHPKVKGGITSYKNCILACSSCNSTKSNRDIVEYYEFLSGKKYKEEIKKEKIV